MEETSSKEAECRHVGRASGLRSCLSHLLCSVSFSITTGDNGSSTSRGVVTTHSPQSAPAAQHGRECSVGPDSGLLGSSCGKAPVVKNPKSCQGPCTSGSTVPSRPVPGQEGSTDLCGPVWLRLFGTAAGKHPAQALGSLLHKGHLARGVCQLVSPRETAGWSEAEDPPPWARSSKGRNTLHPHQEALRRLALPSPAGSRTDPLGTPAAGFLGLRGWGF